MEVNKNVQDTSKSKNITPPTGEKIVHRTKHENKSDIGISEGNFNYDKYVSKKNKPRKTGGYYPWTEPMEILEIKNMISEKNPPSGIIYRLEATEQTIHELEDMWIEIIQVEA